MSTRDSPGGKGGRCVRLTTYHPCSAERQEIRGLNLPGPPSAISTACCGRDLYLYLYNFSYIRFSRRPDDGSRLQPKHVAVNKIYIKNSAVCDWLVITNWSTCYDHFKVIYRKNCFFRVGSLCYRQCHVPGDGTEWGAVLWIELCFDSGSSVVRLWDHILAWIFRSFCESLQEYFAVESQNFYDYFSQR